MAGDGGSNRLRPAGSAKRVMMETEKSVKADLEALSQRLKDAQQQLILSAAGLRMLPGESLIRRIAELEQAIVATETMIDEMS
ncbi:hypothetical protein [Pseudoxanthobacter sp.]|uniref:hypothetical protein n=1 Tax=Pseudoxanthobacter sp. TaxID=1925742 RepID=UPI002FE208DE